MMGAHAQPIDPIDPIDPETLIQRLRQDKVILDGFCVAFEDSIPFTCQVMESVSMDLEEAAILLQEIAEHGRQAKGGLPHEP